MGKWIIGIYMSGCCELLSEYIDKDIEKDITESNPNYNVDIICLIDKLDFNSKTDFKCLNVNTHKKIELFNDKEANLGCIETFYKFLNILDLYSGNKCLILWGHAYGWCEYNMINKQTNDALDIISIANLCHESRIKVIGCDTCIGVNLEVLCEYDGKVNYICGNMDFTDYEGIDYKPVIDSITEITTSEELAVLFGKSMSNNEKRVCVICTDGVSEVIKQLNDLASLLLNEDLEVLQNLRKKMIEIDSLFIDMESMINTLCTYDTKYNDSCDYILKRMREATVYISSENVINISITWPIASEEWLKYKSYYDKLKCGKGYWYKFLSFVQG